jgi:hypothetical protein
MIDIVKFDSICRDKKFTEVLAVLNKCKDKTYLLITDDGYELSLINSPNVNLYDVIGILEDLKMQILTLANKTKIIKMLNENE